MKKIKSEQKLKEILSKILLKLENFEVNELKNSQFELGDTVNSYTGEEKTIKKTCSELGFSYGHAKNCAWVAREFPLAVRKYQLSFRHYYETLRITAETHDKNHYKEARCRILERAEKGQEKKGKIVKFPADWVKNECKELIDKDKPQKTMLEKAETNHKKIIKIQDRLRVQIDQFRVNVSQVELSESKKREVIKGFILIAEWAASEAAYYRNSFNIKEENLIEMKEK